MALENLSLLIPSKTRGIKKAKEDGIRLIPCLYFRNFFFLMSWNILLLLCEMPPMMIGRWAYFLLPVLIVLLCCY